MRSLSLARTSSLKFQRLRLSNLQDRRPLRLAGRSLPHGLEALMIRLGIVDFDSSHSVEFTRRFNHVGMDADQIVEGARVVLGCPGTSLMSPERIPGFTEQIRACGVELVETPEEMIGRIDAVLILSICGAAHLERVRPFLEAKIPAYVDKPFACSLADAREIFRLANEHQVPLFSTSAMRFSAEVEAFQKQSALTGPVNGVISYGPAKRADGNPGLFHYGIHAVEILCTLMGTGCRQVSTQYTEGAEVVTCRWEDDRIGVIRGQRQGSTAYGFLAFCENGVIHQAVSARYSYRNLCRQIVRTFETKQPAVPSAATLEVVALIEASLASERSGGSTIELPADLTS